jgi:hypothetical protein
MVHHRYPGTPDTVRTSDLLSLACGMDTSRTVLLSMRSYTAFAALGLALQLALPCPAVTVYSQVPMKMQPASTAQAASTTVVRHLLFCGHIRNRTSTHRATQPTQARRPTTRSCSPFRLCHRTSRKSSVMPCPRKSLRVRASSSAATSTVSQSRCPSATRPVCVPMRALGSVLTFVHRSGQELDEHQRALPEPHGKPRAARRERQRPRRRQHAGAGRARGLHPRRRVRIRRAGIARTARADWTAASCPRTMYTRPAARARPRSRIRRTCCT